MKKFKRRLSLVLVFVLSLCILPQNIKTVLASPEVDSTVIHIKNEEDFIQFALDCTLDSYSKGKTFILDRDLQLSGKSFTPIGIFEGVFNGNDKKISGVNIDSVGSNIGLFRYLKSSGEIRSLTVEGIVVPEGTKSFIGGLVGSSNGRIIDCHFYGTVKGKSTLGGLVGINGPEGYISGSSSEGTITAESITGGIAGKNEGMIIDSINKAQINTSSIEPNFKIQDIGLDYYKSDKDAVLHTDTGGIAGFSEGIIKSCTNYGEIGYPHVGYNVGGIAGRQSGYMSKNTNHGNVFGRKDVSGIVGQMEPYLKIKFSEDPLQKIDKELKTLKNMMNSSLDTIDSSSQDASDRLKSIRGLTNDASDEVKDMINATTDFADETAEQVNEISYRFSSFMDDVEPALDDISLASENLSQGLDKMSEAFDHLETTSQYTGFMAEKLKGASDGLTIVTHQISLAMGKIADGTELLEKNLGDPEKMKKAIEDIKEGFDSLKEASDAASDLMTTLGNLLEELKDLGGVDWEKYGSEIRAAAERMDAAFQEASPKIADGLTAILEVASDDVETIKKAFGFYASAFELLENASSNFQIFTTNFSAAMNDLKTVSVFAQAAFDSLEEGTTYFSKTSTNFKNAVDKIDGVVEELNAKPDIVFPKLGDTLNEPTDNFFELFDEISEEMDGLNTSTSDSREEVIDDFKNINNQLGKVFDVIMDARKKALEGMDLYKDISESELLVKEDQVILGYVVNSKNTGDVDGDINIGGVVGSMAIDYDFDPEGELTESKDKTLRFQYQTRAVLYKSINTGHIVSKKDYTGGIVGRMDCGIAISAENYGSVKSTDGEYVGGIGGYSSTTIRDSYSKSPLSGKSFVGGIVGEGEKVYDSYSLVRISDGEENIGSIAGKANGEFKNNYFVQNKWAGIDNLSYKSSAEPMEYSKFMALESLPDKFKEFSITFKADDKIIKIVNFDYGDSISKDNLPSIPEKDGNYGKWPEYDFNNLVFSDTLDAIYTPHINTIASKEESDNGMALLLAEGIFNPDSKLSLKDAKISPNYDDRKYSEIATMNITIDNEYKYTDDGYTYRYYYPNKKKPVKIMYLDGNDWVRAKVKVDGSYLMFNLDKRTVTFTVLEDQSSNLAIYISLGALTLLLLLGLIVLKTIKKKKKAKKTTENTVNN